MTQRTKTVKGVGICNPTGKKWIGYVFTYGRYGEWDTKRDAAGQLLNTAFGDEEIVDCTIIFQLPELHKEREAMTKTVKPELLPCPFCGSFAIDGTIKGVEFYAVICHNCGASTGYKKKGDDAIAAWNRRTNTKGEEMTRITIERIEVDRK